MVSAKIIMKDKRKLNKAFNRLGDAANKPIKEILKKHGRLFCTAASRTTPRIGKKASIGRDQKKDIKVTILHTYMRPLNVAKVLAIRGGMTAKKRFSGYIRKRDTAKAQMLIDTICPEIDGYRIVVSMFDNGRLHKKRLKGKLKQRMCVMDWRSVTQYMKKTQLKTGEEKAGWVTAAKMIGGGNSFPAYIKKNHNTKGSARIKGRGSKSILIIKNNHKRIKKNTSMNRAWTSRLEKIQKDSTKLIRKTIREELKKL